MECGRPGRTRRASRPSETVAGRDARTPAIQSSILFSSTSIGIDEPLRSTIAEQLSRLLADTYTLFQTLHLMFEQQYMEMALAVDLIAERIRALGVRAPGSYGEFTKLTSLIEAAAWILRSLLEN